MVVHKAYGDKMSLCDGIPEGHAAIATGVDVDVTCQECIEIINIQKRNKQ